MTVLDLPQRPADDALGDLLDRYDHAGQLRMQQRGADAAVEADHGYIAADAQVQLGRGAVDDDGEYGRIDLAILERVQRVWSSDMTDALARQQIQRWTGQLVPPESLGAHVSASFSHQSGRYMSMSPRGATALYGHSGIEADITQLGQDDIAELAGWIELYQRYRGLLHSGRVTRIDTPDDTAWMHGVVAADRSAALVSYVQLDEPRNDQPAALRVPGLDPARRYQVSDVTPGPRSRRRRGLSEPGVPAVQVGGAALTGIGLAIAPRRALTAAVILIEALA